VLDHNVISCPACDNRAEIGWSWCPRCGAELHPHEDLDGIELLGEAATMGVVEQGPIRALTAKARKDLAALESLERDCARIIAHLAEEPALPSLLKLGEKIQEAREEASVACSKVPSAKSAEDASAARSVVKDRLRRGRRSHARILQADRRILTVCDDGKMRIHEALGGAILEVFSGHEGRALQVLSLSSTEAATSGEDGTVRIWNLEERRARFVIEAHQGWVGTLANLGQGKICSGGEDGLVVEISVKDGRSKEIGSINGEVTCISPRYETSLMAIGDEYGNISIIDYDNRRTQKKIELGSRINDLAWTKAGRIFAALGDGTIALIDADTCLLEEILEGHNAWVESVYVDEENGWIISSGGDGVIQFRDIGTRTVRFTDAVGDTWTSNLIPSIDGNWMWGGLGDGRIWTWSFEEMAPGPILSCAIHGIHGITPLRGLSP